MSKRVKSLAKSPATGAASSIAVTAIILSTVATLGISAPVTAQDGEFRFQLKDYWLGKQAQIRYQVTPWLDLSWQYDEIATDKAVAADVHVADASFADVTRSGNSEGYQAGYQSGYQYNANLRVLDETGQLPAVYVGARDFLNNQQRRSYLVQAQKHVQDWRVGLGYANGKGLDGVQAAIAYTGFAPYVELAAQYHAQQDKLLNPDASPEQQRIIEAPQYHIRATYRPTPWAELSLTHDPVKTLGLSASIVLDSKASGRSGLFGYDGYSEHTNASDITRENGSALSSDIAQALALMNISVLAQSLDDGLLTLVVSADAHPHWPDAIAQAQLLLNRVLPLDIDAVEYIITQHGHALYATRQSVVHAQGVAANLANRPMSGARMRLMPLNNTHTTLFDEHAFAWLPDISVGLDNVFYQPPSLLNAQNTQSTSTLGYYFGLSLDADWRLGQGWGIDTTVQLDVAEKLFLTPFAAQHTADKQTSGIMPLRALSEHNLIKDSARVTQALLSKRGTVVKAEYQQHTSIHYQVFAGLVSPELSGVAGQVLIQPWQSRIAFGINLAQVTVIEPELLALYSENYINDAKMREHTSTGTVSAYWATPWHNIDVSVEAGQFIGRDKGAVVNIKRTFDNGWQFGMYSAQTRLNGEYYSDNGIRLSIPLDGLLNKVTGGLLNQRKVRYQSSIRQRANNAGYSLSEITSDIWWQQRDARYDVFNAPRG